MKQYDQVFISDKDEQLFQDISGPGPVIVCKIQDLKDIWDAGWRAKYFEHNASALYTDFKDYMKHKGIDL